MSTERAGGGSPDEPARPARTRNADATRQALLVAAVRRFTLLGYERTTTRDVAADAGVNVALIMRYFGSKQGLFEAALAQAAEGASPLLDALTGMDDIAPLLAGEGQREILPGYRAQDAILLWARAAGDPRTDQLRKEAIQAYADGLLRAAGGRVTRERRLRAQLLLACATGVNVLRATAGVDPLTAASADELLGPLDDIVHALLDRRPQPARS